MGDINKTKDQLCDELKEIRTKYNELKEKTKPFLSNLETEVIVDNDISFEALFNIDDIQELQDEYSAATGVASIITKPDGSPLTRPSNFCRLCSEIIRKTKKGLINCYRSDAELGKPNLNGPIIKRCLSGGLWDAGASIIVGGKHIANWLIGQVRDETQTDEKIRAYANEIGADENTVIRAFNEVPSMSREQFEIVSKALFKLANKISQLAYQNLKNIQIISKLKETEKSLKLSEFKLRNLFNAMEEVVIEIDYNGTYINIAPTSPELLINPTDETIGKTLHDLFPKEQADIFLKFVRNTIDNNKADKIVYPVIINDKTLWFEGKANPIGNNRVLYIASDITKRKQAEESLLIERNMFSEGPVFVITWEPTENWPVKYVSDNIHGILGYNPEQMTGDDFRYSDLIHPDDVHRIGEEVSYYINNGFNVFEQSYRLKHSDGNYLWFYDFTRLIRDNKNNVTEIRGYMFDQTNLKNAQTEIEFQKHRLSSVIEGTNVGTWEWNVQTGETLFNERWAEIIGYTLEELAPISVETWLQNAHPEDLLLSQEKLEEHFAGKTEYYDIECRMKHKAGHWVWVQDRGRVTSWTNDKKPKWMYGTHTDISERKKSELALKNSEERFRLLAENIPGVIYLCKNDERWSMIYLNNLVETLTGYKADDFISDRISFADLYHPDDVNQIYDIVDQALNNKKAFHLTYRLRHKNGNWIWVEEFGIGIYENDKVVALEGFLSDITIQKKNSLIQNIIHNISNAVITSVSLEDFIVLVRNELREIIDVSNFYLALYDERNDNFELIYHHDIIEKHKSFPAGKTFTAYVAKTKKPLLATGNIINELIESGEAEIIGTLSKTWLGLPLLVNGRVLGVMVLQNYYNAKAYNESDVKILEIISHQISISLERKKSEQDLKNALEKAQQSDRLKSSFLANMSHEIRTPMNGILGFSSLLKEPQLSGDEKDEYINIIEKSGNRMLNTINDIIDISKIEAGLVEVTKTELSVHEILNEQFKFFQPEANKKGLKLTYSPTAEDIEIQISTDKHKLESILTNLIKNAIKYTNRGEIQFGFQSRQNNDKKELVFFVKDTGIGIPSSRINAVFNRFEQADIEDTRVYEGSGLGLAITKSYVEMLGGKISLSSIEGSGSTFSFTIPYSTQFIEKSKSKLENTAEQNAILKNLSILVAEDDEVNRLFFETILKNKFKKVNFTTNGKETIKECRDNPDTDIILMDIKMNDINGYEATREIRKFNKDVIIIAQTAYGLSSDREKAIKSGCNDYIAKPIIREKLFKIIYHHINNKNIN